MQIHISPFHIAVPDWPRVPIWPANMPSPSRNRWILWLKIWWPKSPRRLKCWGSVWARTWSPWETNWSPMLTTSRARSSREWRSSGRPWLHMLTPWTLRPWRPLCSRRAMSWEETWSRAWRSCRLSWSPTLLRSRRSGPASAGVPEDRDPSGWGSSGPD